MVQLVYLIREKKSMFHNKSNVSTSVNKMGGGIIFAFGMDLADTWLCAGYLVSDCAGRVGN